MDIFLHQGHYQGDSDNDYKSTQVYKIWIKQEGSSIFVIKQDKSKSSKREYKHINEFFSNWGMIFRDCHNIKLK